MLATPEVLATEGISQKQTYHQHHRQEPAAEMIATAEGVGNRRDITKTDIPGTSWTRKSSKDDSHSRGVSNRRDITKADMPRTSQTRNSGRDVATAEVLATEGKPSTADILGTSHTRNSSMDTSNSRDVSDRRGCQQKQTHLEHYGPAKAARTLATAGALATKGMLGTADMPGISTGTLATT